MRWMKIEGPSKLEGSLTVPGSKNSSLAILAAACLASEPVTLKNIPNIADFRVLREIGEEIGCVMNRDILGDVHIDPTNINNPIIEPEKSGKFRTAYYFIGALLAKFGKVSLGYPGGDDFVSRPIDQHIKAFEKMGATFTFHKDYYIVEASRLNGATIYFDTITSGATINSMLAAVLAEGETILLNAARDPEVTDTALFLNQMGAKITGAGTDTIKIKGVKQLNGCSYSVIPDRLIAGAFLISSGITGGTITVEDIIPEHLTSCLTKLKEIGVGIEIKENNITSFLDGRINATRVRTAMFPGFPTDLQQPLTVLLTQANGRSVLRETVYPNRFNHVYQLNKMGASIEVANGVAHIKGKSSLQGALVNASDVRAGICLMLAGVIAEGTTTITGIEHIERGYDEAVTAFNSLGANISLHQSDEITDDLMIAEVKKIN
ncbi:UDP-N-acetylglucosamine 1-carboxyvinyltransferase [Niallia alba]|uniref:UDP-N-acetylglucosamine 1-carboxyvinyltransferase n=1 Tax=Niallia alba TaxID=2729105 RepID=UPI00399F192F